MKKTLFALLFVTIFSALSIAALPSRAEASVGRVHKFEMPSAFKVFVNSNLSANELKISFSNLIFAKNVSYELTYNHSAGYEGVSGEFNTRGIKSVSKTVTLGTCSSGGTCVYHSGISDMKLKVTTKYKLFNISETVTYSL